MRELGLGVRDTTLKSSAGAKEVGKEGVEAKDSQEIAIGGVLSTHCATRRRMDTNHARFKFLPFNDQQSVQGKRCRAYGPFHFNRLVGTCPSQRSGRTGPHGTKGTDESMRDEHIVHTHQITLTTKLHRLIHVWTHLPTPFSPFLSTFSTLRAVTPLLVTNRAETALLQEPFAL